jgi:hypothetical protein
MTENEMEELLWNHSEKFLNEQLIQFKRQPQSAVGRADLVFTDRLGRILVIEIKKGILPRGAVPQLLDYFGMLKREFPDKSVELMVVANAIPPERVLSCLQHHIEPREISEKKFRDIAHEIGFEFSSEMAEKQTTAATHDVPRSQGSILRRGPNKVEKGWYYFIDANKNPTILAFVNQKGNCSMRVFEAAEGAFLGRKYALGDFQDAFKDHINAAQSLHVTNQPNLEKHCKPRLPSVILQELQRQIRKISS